MKTRSRRLAVGLVVGGGCWLLAACSSTPLPPPVAQAPAAPTTPYPGLQSVPQLPTTGGDHQHPMVSYCVLPPGSELRVFSAPTSHGDGLFSVVNTHDLAPTNPWKCP